MRVPFEWLKEFVVIDVEPHELASRLTMRGLEVEAVEEYFPQFQGVIAGEILSMERHPEAHNLSLCKIDIGREVLSIICGAKNISAGNIVPVATVGARLADGTVIENREIRGVTSPGVLVSEKELGLSDDHTGIFLLEKDIKAGVQLRDVGSFSDFVLDINVPPNRGDCSSVYGIAREVASTLGQKARIMSFDVRAEEKENIDDYVGLDVLNQEACPRYVLMMLKGITINKSPYSMRSRLIKCGMRPINSIVDVTNYVMLELGQPLHAFDYRKLRGQRIEVRTTDAETVFRTLDGEDRKLEAGDLLICDGSGPVAIAGIMGGENSEIGPDTEDVALESALFNPLFIRRTSRRLGLKSEASLRFEKGVDIDNVQFAGERAIFLMNKLSGGAVVSGKKELYRKREPKQIFVDYGRINDILGVTIEHRDIVSALRSIDLHVVKEEESGFLVSVPAFRYDINEYMDIIEEVARIHGYDHIPATTPVTALRTHRKDRVEHHFGNTKDYLRSAGFYEVINFAFFGTKDIENFLIPPEDERAATVKIMNPLSKEYGVMRTFIAAGLLRNVGYNLNRGSKNLKFFEMGKVFSMNGEGVRLEFPSVCLALSGKEREYFWRESTPEHDFFDLKGVVEGLLEDFGLKSSFERTHEPFLNENDSADVFVDGAKIGWIGEIKEEVLKSYEIEQKVYCAELRFDIISSVDRIESRKYKPIPRYPQVVRDFSFFMDEGIPVSQVIERIEKASPLITSVGIFDMFKKDVRSIALRVTFQSYEDTLTDEEVNSLQMKIIEEITSVNGITLRT